MVQSFLPILAAALVPLASAHVALWTPSGFYERNDGYEAATPLANKGSGEFWFHGVNKPSGNITPTKLPVGKEVTLELSCNKQYTSMGNGRSSGNIACPNGVEEWKSLHINPDRPVYLGCALAIAYKSLDQISSLEDIKTEDFTVFSVKNECVKDLKTNFAIPQTMPKCPPGGCICAWFWQGQDSANGKLISWMYCLFQR